MLESRAVTKVFGGLTAVNRVSLCLEPGHSYAMLGPNGSGKTTWMKMAADLLLPTSGEMLLDGRAVGRDTRARTAYMSTEGFLYPWMTVRDAGMYFQRVFPGYDMDDYIGLVGRMGLKPQMRVKALSSGMMAKLKVAVTLARRARVYLFDEPFNGIDLIARDEIGGMIMEHMTQDTVMALSSHLVEELEAVTDRSVFMHEGQVLAVYDNGELRGRGVSLADAYRQVYGMQRRAGA